MELWRHVEEAKSSDRVPSPSHPAPILRLRKSFGFIIGLLQFTGLHFDDSGKFSSWRMARILRAFALTGVVVFYVHYDLYTNLTANKPIIAASLKWMTLSKSFISMIFFIYWQLSGNLCSLRSIMNDPLIAGLQPYEKLRSVDRICSIAFLTIFILVNVIDGCIQL
ncbi:hypothetical protein AAVH_41160, partial [Aphelenchoides avenae]